MSNCPIWDVLLFYDNSKPSNVVLIQDICVGINGIILDENGCLLARYFYGNLVRPSMHEEMFFDVQFYY